MDCCKHTGRRCVYNLRNSFPGMQQVLMDILSKLLGACTHGPWLVVDHGAKGVQHEAVTFM